jgi:putative heme-binding domain-containing protein
VQRRGAEALVRQGMKAGAPPFAPVADIYALLKSPDRFVRYSGRVALEHTPKEQWVKLVMAETNVVALTEGLLAIANTTPEPQAQSELRPVFEKLLALMQRTTLTADEKIRVLRTFEVAAAQSPSGIDPEIKKQVYAVLVKQLPTAAPAGAWVPCTNQTGPKAQCSQFLLAHHLAKVLAYTGEPDVVGRILAIMPKGDEDQPGQIDLMYSLRMIDTGWTQQQKQQAIDWFAKASKWRGGSTFAGHVNTIFDATIDAFTADEKQMAYKAAPLFAPITEDIAATAAAAAPDPAGRGGGRGRGPQVPLDRQERFDNLVFPRGGGPGSLAGRGGAPNAVEGGGVFRETCAQCHRYGTVGKDFAPDLTRVAERLQRRDILRSIFFPNEKVDAKYVTTVLALKDGKTVRGLLVSETAQNVVVKTAEDAEPVTVAKNLIAKRATEAKSIMPDDIADKVSDAGVRDVTAYIMQMVK